MQQPVEWLGGSWTHSLHHDVSLLACVFVRLFLAFSNVAEDEPGL